ncbi:hypothetical protein ABZP36_010396 [Zizania latifolia]
MGERGASLEGRRRWEAESVRDSSRGSARFTPRMGHHVSRANLKARGRQLPPSSASMAARRRRGLARRRDGGEEGAAEGRGWSARAAGGRRLDARRGPGAECGGRSGRRRGCEVRGLVGRSHAPVYGPVYEVSFASPFAVRINGPNWPDA